MRFTVIAFFAAGFLAGFILVRQRRTSKIERSPLLDVDPGQTGVSRASSLAPGSLENAEDAQDSEAAAPMPPFSNAETDQQQRWELGEPVEPPFTTVVKMTSQSELDQQQTPQAQITQSDDPPTPPSQSETSSEPPSGRDSDW